MGWVMKWEISGGFVTVFDVIQVRVFMFMHSGNIYRWQLPHKHEYLDYSQANPSGYHIRKGKDYT
jgi:hypothetical protein